MPKHIGVLRRNKSVSSARNQNGLKKPCPERGENVNYMSFLSFVFPTFLSFIFSVSFFAFLIFFLLLITEIRVNKIVEIPKIVACRLTAKPVREISEQIEVNVILRVKGGVTLQSGKRIVYLEGVQSIRSASAQCIYMQSISQSIIGSEQEKRESVFKK